MTRNFLARAGVALAVIISYGGLVATAGHAAAAPAPAAAAAPKYQWPEAHGNVQLTGVSDDPSITTANAGNLGVKWMANLGDASLTSPIVGYNQALGETLVYAGSEGGWFSAFNAKTGKTVWSVNLGSPVRMTPTLDGPYVWVADTYSPTLYKLNAATGAEQCSTSIYAVAEASPIVVTPPGGTKTVYMGSNDLAESGPLYAVNESNCSVDWSFDNYEQTSGLWDMISYGVDAPTSTHPHGEPLVLFGTADPDAGIYALDAVTGKLVWHFQTFNPNDGPADVGAGVTISPPGVNGFADGAAYVPSKDGRLYALNLTTGKKLWGPFVFEPFPPVGNGSRDTACLDGDNVVFGTTVGTFDVNAITGKEIWEQPFPTLPNEVLGAPAIAGPSGGQVVYTVNVNGQFEVLSLATGAILYTYQTSNYLASSPAVWNNNVLFTAANGFLYDMALGGGNSTTAPSTAVTSPAQGSTVPNPDSGTKDGTITISGTASESGGAISRVQVAVQQGGETGTWWSKVDNAWEPGIFDNEATLATPGAATTAWSIKVPVPAAGAILEVRAAAVDDHTADTSSDESESTPARVDFTVAPSTTAPTLQVSPSRAGPGSQVTLTGGGYQPGEMVAVTLPTKPVITLATLTATSTGALPSTPATIPISNPSKPAVGTPFGPMTVSAVGQTSGNTGTATLVVSNNWDQYGDTPTRDFFELNDLAATDNVAASGRFYYDQAYNFPTLSPIQSTVAINNGVDFFGDNAGDFYAVNVSTAAPVWEDTSSSNTTTYTPPDQIIDSSGGIDSSAAVDPDLQIGGTPEPAVILGTEADSSGKGSVTAVNEDTGVVLWTRPTTSGVESSPVIYDNVVYVNSDNGTFYALNERTGAVEWTTPLTADATTGAPQSSPTIDDSVAHPSVVVGNGDDVTAMNLTTGKVLWSEKTGGLVTATPTYFSNNIYVGSQDGSEYGFNGSTGALLWSYSTGDASGPTPGAGGPIMANNVTFGQEIAVGSTNGTIYYLTASGGQLQNSLPGTVPVVGMAGAVNFAVATLSNGTAIATRITGIDQTWKYYGDGYGFDSAPVIDNGNVYMTGLDDNLHVFAVPGRPVY